jgi:hypothetical protein
MGYDLCPVKKGIFAWSVNMSGWFGILNALDALGADMTSASSTNDGKRVLKKTAIAWGNLMKESIESGRLKRVGPFLDYFPDHPDGVALDEQDHKHLMSFVHFCFDSSGFRIY